MLLFLLAAGLTLVFGIMNFVNLAHGSFYMLGAYLGAAVYTATGSFVLAAIAAVTGTLVIGIAIERTTLIAFYARDHLYQVLATVGLILFFNEVARILWGPSAIYMRAPQGFTGAINLMGIPYPSYRFLVILVGLFVAVGLHILIHHTRIGMWL